MSYASRLGKICASIRAWWMAVRDPPRLDADIRTDQLKFRRRTAAILVTNNPLGEGHIPYADDPRQGMLGLYVANSPRWQDLVVMAVRMAVRQLLGESASRQLGRERGRHPLAAPRVSASVDGEIVSLETPLRCRLHRGGLNVVKPRSEARGRIAPHS